MENQNKSHRSRIENENTASATLTETGAQSVVSNIIPASHLMNERSNSSL
jgi:hypothetical protein